MRLKSLGYGILARGPEVQGEPPIECREIFAR
jgi:hypothetical protein